MVTKETLDVLDNYFNNEVAKMANLDDLDRWDTTKVEFHLDPIYWDLFYHRIKPFTFNWQEFKYSDLPDLTQLIPSDDVGIYMFIVKSGFLIYGLPQFLLYVGISGEKGSERPLRERLNDYFNLNNITKRNKLHRLIKRYYHNTYVVFSTIDRSIVSVDQLEQLEKDLHGFFIPPANDRDFPIEVKPLIKAQFTR